MNFSDSAKDLSKNPLGIIALFIVLVYGFACLLFGFSAKELTPNERLPLIWFTSLFPVLVLGVFAWLVAKHYNKLYAPRDYRDDDSFLKAIRQNDQKFLNAQESSKEVEKLMQYGKDFELVKEQEINIQKDLESRHIDYSNNTAKVLIRHLAGSQVLTWFEKTYNTLFGSQIQLLINLKANPLTLEFLEDYFNGVKFKYPLLSSWDTKNYLAFLFSSKLIENKDNLICITRLGEEFLTLFEKSGYPIKQL